jgi:maltooligosyltrehalose trehalohydrolase
MREFLNLAFGATSLESYRTRFRIWAPSQEKVWVQIEDGESWPMQRDDEGWFEAEIACGRDTIYRYRLNTGLTVPDPASRAQLEDVHGPSLVVDPNAYRWRRPNWRGRPWHETVLYELHPGLLGGFAGVQARLPGLKEVGVTAVELMPINDFPGSRNWGYERAALCARSQLWLDR